MMIDIRKSYCKIYHHYKYYAYIYNHRHYKASHARVGDSIVGRSRVKTEMCNLLVYFLFDVLNKCSAQYRTLCRTLPIIRTKETLCTGHFFHLGEFCGELQFIILLDFVLVIDKSIS